MWSNLRAAVPQGSSALQSLASSLPDVASASRAPSTSSKYFSSYNRWRSWVQEHGLTVFPASPFHFAIYLRHLMTEAKTASPLESAVHSISWFHQLGGEPSPSDHPLVKSTLAGAQRFMARACHSVSIRAVSCLKGGLNGLFVQHSFGCYLLTSFCCFLRFDELAKPVRSDVKIEDVMLSYLFNLVKLISIEMELGLL